MESRPVQVTFSFQLPADDPRIPELHRLLSTTPEDFEAARDSALNTALRTGTDTHRRVLAALAAASPERLSPTELARQLGISIEALGGSLGSLKRRIAGDYPDDKIPWEAGPGWYSLSGRDARIVLAAPGERQ